MEAHHDEDAKCTCSACQLHQLATFPGGQDSAQCQTWLSAAIRFYEKHLGVLDQTLFEAFGPAVSCANLSPACNVLVEEYLQLVVEHCSGREVLTMLMALLDAAAGRPADLTPTQLKLLATTCTSLSSISAPASSTLIARDNQTALVCFILHIIVHHTSTKPLQQSQDFHRHPGFNFGQEQQQAADSASATALVQLAMQWLSLTGITSAAELGVVVQRLQHPDTNSRLPDPDDAAFLEPSDALLGAACAVYAGACVPGCAASCQMPSQANAILGLVHQHAGVLLETASSLQNVVLAQKGLALVAAAANQITALPQEDRAEVTSSVIGLVEWLEATMQHNPLPPLRNMAYWTMNHLLDALQGVPALRLTQELVARGPPGIAALMLHRLQQQASLCWGNASDQQWRHLQNTLLDSCMQWLNPQGEHGWQKNLEVNIEPICAALNTCRFLLLREGAQQSNLTGVRTKAKLRQLQTHVHSLTSVTQRLLHDSLLGDIVTTLGVSRTLEVLSRVSDLVDDEVKHVLDSTECSQT